MTRNLYNCRSSGEGNFLVNKFDLDINPEATYALSLSECDCPAGSRPTCKHRKMLAKFIALRHVDDGWFLCWETGIWHRPVGLPEATVPFLSPPALSLPEATSGTAERAVHVGSPIATPGPTPPPVVARPEGAQATTLPAPSGLASRSIRRRI